MNTAKKLAVLEQLRAQSEAVSLLELLALLPAEFAERSVRRWLSELEDAGRVVKTGRKRGTRYRALADSSSESPGADAGSTQGVTKPMRFSQAAQSAVAYVSQPLFQRAPVAYDAAWLAAYEPNRTTYFPPRQPAKLWGEGRRAPVGDPAGTYARRIYNRLLIDLSHHSSRLEGNTYSLLDTERLLLEGQPADGKLDMETVMILNHKEAIRHLVEQSVPGGVSHDEILTLHFLLSDALLATEHSGAIRDHGVRVSGSVYIPLEDRVRLERQLRSIAEKAAAIADPYEQSLFLLVHITYLQAFADVNKRTARLCANLPLLRQNLVPLSFNAVNKDDYAAAVVSIYELKEPRPMAELYAASYLRTCAQYDATVEASGFDAVRVRYRAHRRKAVAGIVADVAVGEALAERVRAAAAEVPVEDRQEYVEDLQEDLEALSPARIAGLGISQQQLRGWLAARAESTNASTPTWRGPMTTIDLNKVVEACFSNSRIRKRICDDFGIEEPDTAQDLAVNLVQEIGQVPPAGHSWEDRLDNHCVFRAAVHALGSNSRKWSAFLQHESRLKRLLHDYDPAAVREEWRSGESTRLEDDIRECLPGQTVRNDSKAILRWAELLGAGPSYYDCLIDLRGEMAALPQVDDDEAVPMVAAVLGNASKRIDKRWPRPSGLKTWKTPGMGFVLACEFLRNLYWDGFKPDRHIQRLLGRWFPEYTADLSTRAGRLATEAIGSRSKSLVEPLQFSLLGMQVSPPGRLFSEVDNLLWALGSYVEKKGRESDTDYVAR